MIPRPTEDYALARVTILEKLAALDYYKRRAVILYVSGFRFVEQGEMLSISPANQGQQWNKALRQVRTDA